MLTIQTGSRIVTATWIAPFGMKTMVYRLSGQCKEGLVHLGSPRREIVQAPNSLMTGFYSNSEEIY